MRYAHVINYVSSSPWAILPEKFYAILEFIELKVSTGILFTEAEIAARVGPKDEINVNAPASIAVLPIFGTIAHRAGLLRNASGGMSVESFTKDFRAVLQNPDISAIVLDIDSPGGSTSGIEELADEIYSARGKKRIVASVNSLAASAAYWIASSAHEIAVTPSGHVGSIGVLGVHMDLSEKAKKEGIRMTVVSSGRYKAEGNEFAPLTEEARQHIQGLVDDRYDAFVRAVARGRGVALKTVREGFGEGRLVTAKDSLAFGMADSIETMDQVISRTLKRAAKARRIADAASWAYGTEGSGDLEAVMSATANELESQEERGFVTQTLIAAKKHWRSLDAAKSWAKEHGYRTDKVDENETSWRFRQRDPNDFQRLRTICINPGRNASPDLCRMQSVGGPLKASAAVSDFSLLAAEHDDCPRGEDCPMEDDMDSCPEGSDCPMGAKARARIKNAYYAAEYDNEGVEEFLQAGVIPKDVSQEIAPEGTVWAAPALKDFTAKTWDELTDSEKRRIAMHAAWAGEMPPASFGSIKLFHHRPSDGFAVPNGVRNALARLNQTQDLGTDRPRVEAHLRAHMDKIQRRREEALANPKLDPKKRLVELLELG